MKRTQFNISFYRKPALQKGTSISGKEKATIRNMKTMKGKGASPMAQ